MGITRTRIAVSLSVSVAAVASVAGTAGARIPEGDFVGGSAVAAQPAVAVVPDAVDRALGRRARTLDTKYAGTDAVARAIARRNR